MNAKRAKKAKTSTTKLFVLDTNVLMHDPLSLSVSKSTTSTCR
jgi:hypothetical protein